MQNIPAQESLSLAPRQLMSLWLEQEQAIQVVCGLVWITIEADVTDYWLAAGETLLLAQHRHIVIEAGPERSRIDVLPQRIKPAVLARHTAGNLKLCPLSHWRRSIQPRT